MRNERRQLDALVETMFVCDARGRMTGSAPQLHIVRTDQDVVCRCHADVPDVLVAEIETLAMSPRGRPTAWADSYAQYVELVQRHGEVKALRAGPLYRFPTEIPDPLGCTSIDDGNIGLLRSLLPEWVEDAQSGTLMAAAVEDGQAVSVCASVRTSPSIHCAGVETAVSARGRGFAERAVAAWGKLVRQVGAEPFYATTFDNLSSQKVATRSGLPLAGSEFSLYGTARH